MNQEEKKKRKKKITNKKMDSLLLKLNQPKKMSQIDQFLHYSEQCKVHSCCRVNQIPSQPLRSLKKLEGKMVHQNLAMLCTENEELPETH